MKANELVDKYPFLDEKICNPKLGLVNRIFQWLPEPDDPKIFILAAQMCSKDIHGHQVASSINSAAGFSLKRAYQAAIGESIERYSSSFQPNDIKYSTFKNLKEEAVDPNQFAFYADEQYLDNEFPYTKFIKDSFVGWTKAINLFSGKQVYVPAATVYLPYNRNKNEAKIWDCVSTGLACGDNIYDALLRGIYEVIERDAISNMWFNELSMPTLDVESNQKMSTLFHQRIELNNCNYHFIDISTETGIYTYFGILEDNNGGALVAASANNNPEKAFQKVMLELSQGRITWKEDFVKRVYRKFKDDFSDIRDFHSRVELYTQPKMKKYLNFVYNSTKKNNIPKVPYYDGDSKQVLQKITKQIHKLGYETLYVDVTPEDIRQAGYYVVKVLIPGFTEITNDTLTPRVGGERLKRLPKKLGYLNRETNFSEYNKVPHPFP